MKFIFYNKNFSLENKFVSKTVGKLQNIKCGNMLLKKEFCDIKYKRIL